MTEIYCVILDIIKPHLIKSCSSYTTYFTKWKKWAASFREVREVKDLPGKEIYVSIYLVSLLHFQNAFPVINSSFYAIKFFHNLPGYSIKLSTKLIRTNKTNVCPCWQKETSSHARAFKPNI